eukprot:1157589-Pelagomonas_calceolata.AAC.2
MPLNLNKGRRGTGRQQQTELKGGTMPEREKTSSQLPDVGQRLLQHRKHVLAAKYTHCRYCRHCPAWHTCRHRQGSNHQQCHAQDRPRDTDTEGCLGRPNIGTSICPVHPSSRHPDTDPTHVLAPVHALLGHLGGGQGLELLERVRLRLGILLLGSSDAQGSRGVTTSGPAGHDPIGGKRAGHGCCALVAQSLHRSGVDGSHDTSWEILIHWPSFLKIVRLSDCYQEAGGTDQTIWGNASKWRGWRQGFCFVGKPRDHSGAAHWTPVTRFGASVQTFSDDGWPEKEWTFEFNLINTDPAIKLFNLLLGVAPQSVQRVRPPAGDLQMVVGQCNPISLMSESDAANIASDPHPVTIINLVCTCKTSTHYPTNSTNLQHTLTRADSHHDMTGKRTSIPESKQYALGEAQRAASKLKASPLKKKRANRSSEANVDPTSRNAAEAL